MIDAHVISKVLINAQTVQVGFHSSDYPTLYKRGTLFIMCEMHPRGAVSALEKNLEAIFFP